MDYHDAVRAHLTAQAVFNSDAIADIIEDMLAAGLLLFAHEMVGELRAILAQDFDASDRRRIVHTALAIDATIA